jgi:3D (Asp-Asp-Asp) domain-containing protein
MMDESPEMELDRLIGLAEERAGEIVSAGEKTGEIGLVEEELGEVGLKSGIMEAAEQEDTKSTVLPFVPGDTDKTSRNGLKVIRPLTAKSKALKAIAAVGLVAVSVLLSYFSALYINATENTGLSSNGITVIEQEELPGGAVVPADPRDDGSGVVKMTATAYDLSFESCGKAPSHPAYGVTSSGTKAAVGRTIAVDPEVIPLGSKVKITFPEKYSYLDGTYVAEDTGRLIKGNRVDVFFGEDKAGSKTVNKLAMDFGVQDVEVEIIE